MKKKLITFLLVILVALSALGTFSGCEKKETLGAVTGSLYIGYQQTLFPDANIEKHKTFADLFNCVRSGLIDRFMLDQPNFNAVQRETGGLKSEIVEEYTVDIGYGFQKNGNGEVLQAQMNEYLKELDANGKKQELLDKWYGDTEPTETVNVPQFSGKEIKVGVDQTRKPFAYTKNGLPCGFEVEVLYGFCLQYNYKPIIENIPFAEGMSGLQGGTYDLVAGGLYMTDGRKEVIHFSDPYMHAPVVMVSYVGGNEVGFWQGLKDSFNRTFVEQGRWLLILKGVGTTIIITLGSALFGTLLGFGVYMLCRTFGKVAKKITKVFTVLLNGTPIVVLLMLLYFVIFGRLGFSGVVCAIIGFSLTMASFVYEKLTVAVSGIDNGQYEAALAMGFTKNKGFFHVILPQAMKFFLPIYQGEMVSLVKATAIVGYIAVEDLTKMVDVIRGDTFEAFFPLIAAALIYLLLAFGLIELMKFIMKKLEPKNRKKEKILKGVKK